MERATRKLLQLAWVERLLAVMASTRAWFLLALLACTMLVRTTEVVADTPAASFWPRHRLGVMTGVDDFLYAYGLSFLPVSTSALLVSNQLAFTALFAFLIVKQRFTPFSLNSIALLTVGAVLLGLHASSDRPAGVSKGQYFTGFFLTLGAATLYGLVLPLVGLTYAKAKQVIAYTLVIEMQLVIGFFAIAFCTVGILVNKDF